MSYGFNYHDLLARNVLGPTLADADPLSQVPIHDVWHYNNWTTTSHLQDEVNVLLKKLPPEPRQRIPAEWYKRMEPGLRLASLMLQASAEFLCDIAFGDEYQVEHDGRRRTWLRPIGDYGAWRLNALEQSVLQTIAHRNYIYFDRLPIDQTQTHAWSGSVACDESFVFFQTSIDPGNLNWIDDDNFDNYPLARKHTLWFYHAVNLMHELCHSIYNTTDLAVCEGNDEPRHPAYPEAAELGVAWEYWFFGGQTEPIGQQRSHFFVNPGEYGTALTMITRGCSVALTADSIAQFFLMPNWATHFQRALSNQPSPLFLGLTSLVAKEDSVQGTQCGCNEAFSMIRATYTSRRRRAMEKRQVIHANHPNLTQAEIFRLRWLG